MAVIGVWLSQNPYDATLPATIEKVKNWIAQGKNLHTRKEKASNDYQTQKKEIDETTTQHNLAVENLQRIDQEITYWTAKQQQYSTKTLRNTDDYTQALQALRDKRGMLDTLPKLNEDYAAASKKIDELKDSIAGLQFTQIRYQQKFMTEQDQIAYYRELVQQRKTTYEAFLAIQTHAQARTALTAGEPCPLCGATTHPYAYNLPQTALPTAKQDLAKAEQWLEECSNRTQKIVQHLFEVTKDIETAENEIQEKQVQMLALEKKFTEAAAKLGMVYVLKYGDRSFSDERQ